MALDVAERTNGSVAVGSPQWWLHRLCGRLALDQPRMVLMDRYYRGEHPLPYIPRVLKAEFRKMLARSRSNFMRIVVQAPAERLRIQGFRVKGSEQADSEVWDWWTDDNEMHVDANLAIADSMSMGRSYLSIWRFDGEDGPRVQVEDPRTTITERDPAFRRKRVAGLRLWVDDWTSTVRADVFLPDAVYRFARTDSAERITSSTLWPQSWSPAYPIDDENIRYTDMVLREEDAASTVPAWLQQWEEIDRLPNPSGEIPLVPLVNQPSVLKQPDGESELDDVYLTQDRINEMLFNRALAAWTTAYRQKWATGLDVPVDEHGEPIEPFQAAIDRLWVAEDPGARFGEFGQTDLKPFIESVEQDVKHIAVQTRTPRHYLVESGQTPSGDSIKSAESGLVAKVGEKQLYLGQAFVEILRLRDVMTNTTPRTMETIWGDPEFRTLGELTDAVIKQFQAGLIDRRTALEALGRSPTEIELIERRFAGQQMVDDARSQLELEAGDEPLEEDEVPANPEPGLVGGG